MEAYKNIARKIENILGLLQSAFTKSELAEVTHFLDVGEYGVAFETLCAIAEEERKEIPIDVYKLIDEVGTQMELDQKIWLSLRNL